MSIEAPREAWERAAEHINARLAEMAVSQRRFAERANVSAPTVRALQRAEQDAYQPDTLGKVSKALGWQEDGLVRLVLYGEQPEVAPAVDARKYLDEVKAFMAEVTRLRLRLMDLEDRLRRYVEQEQG